MKEEGHSCLSPYSHGPLVMPEMSTGDGVGGIKEEAAPEGRSRRGLGRFNILESYITGTGRRASEIWNLARHERASARSVTSLVMIISVSFVNTGCRQ